MRCLLAIFGIVIAGAASASAESHDFAERGARVLDMAVLERCAATKIGAPDCAPSELAEHLGLISGPQMRPFGRFGMESFAMLTSLRYAASALFFMEEGEPCYAEEERGAAVEIWSLWVERSDDMPDVMEAKYAIFDGVMDNLIKLELGC